MDLLKWIILFGVLLPFTGMAGFLFALMGRSTIEDALRETTWQAWAYHAAFLALQAVLAGLFVLLVYFVVTALLSGELGPT